MVFYMQNKGVRDFPYEGQRLGNLLTHLSHQAFWQNIPFKEWQNLLEVHITAQHLFHTHPPIIYLLLLLLHHARSLPTCQRCPLCHRVQQGSLSSHLQQEPVFGKSFHHWLMRQTLTLSSLLVQISTHRTAQPLCSLSKVIPIVLHHRSMTYGMKILFWRPLVLLVINFLGWRFLPTKRHCWGEVLIIGIRVRFLMGGWSR